ncbi:MAG: queuosine precursor transporter [Chlamydiales bacterium]
MFDRKTFLILLWLNILTAVAMATCVFTGQVKVSVACFVFPASNIFFGFLTFPITDLIADIFGRKEANVTVWVGFFSQLLTIFILEVCMLLPGAGEKLGAFRMGGWRVFFGSCVGYLTAQFWDVYFFHWIKEKWTGERHLWLRNNLSTFSSQLINSALFMTIVFGFHDFLIMFPGSILVKWLIALADTPFVYLGRYLIRRELKTQVQS